MIALETVIGLEVHVQLGVRTKLFSPVAAEFGGDPNTRVGPVDAGLPGVLPVLNDAAVRAAIRAALALGGAVQDHSRFARKNYFYPDLPKGYQISQFDEPYCVGGSVPLDGGRSCPLTRIHLEEDAGKSTHGGHDTLVDYNRAGVALIEIVSEPALRSPDDAHLFLTHLKQILQYADVSECSMEQGSLRCDANISLRPAGATELGTKVEIKNLNSFKMVQRALEYEQRRQTAVLTGGGAVEQETRLWNEERGETAAMRGKEASADYRYFPEPDLPPLRIATSLTEAIRAELRELPGARRQRWDREYGLPAYDRDVLLADHAVADYFEAVAGACGDAKTASNWVMGEVLRELNERSARIEQFAIPAAALAALLAAVRAERVSHQAAKKVFAHMATHATDVDAAIAALGLEQVSNRDELAAIVAAVLAANEKAVADYLGGKDKAFHGLKGFVMRETRGRANPGIVDELLRAALDGRRQGPGRGP